MKTLVRGIKLSGGQAGFTLAQFLAEQRLEQVHATATLVASHT